MTAPELHCAGCGAQGHPPVIEWIRGERPEGAVLTPALGWHPDGKPALLCERCKRRLAKNRGRARYAQSKPSDGHMT